LQEQAAQILVNGLISGSTIALLALGFSLVYHTTRIFHIAFAAFYAAGGYLFWHLFVTLQMGIVISLAASTLIPALLSLLLWWLVYKPLIKLGAAHNELMVASIGMMMVVVYLITLLMGDDPKLPASAVTQAIPARFLQLVLNSLIIIIFLIITSATRLGLKIRAFRDNPLLLGRLGINNRHLTGILFLLSGGMAGLGAALSTNDLGISPFTGIHVFINAFIAVVAGGSGRVSGAVAGGLLLGLLQSAVVYVVGSEWILSVSFIVLIIMMLVKPEGITGMARREA
jgi:branched-chain amino acid transport system permease protein